MYFLQRQSMLLSAGLPPKFPQQAGLGQAEARSWRRRRSPAHHAGDRKPTTGAIPTSTQGLHQQPTAMESRSHAVNPATVVRDRDPATCSDISATKTRIDNIRLSKSDSSTHCTASDLMLYTVITVLWSWVYLGIEAVICAFCIICIFFYLEFLNVSFWKMNPTLKIFTEFNLSERSYGLLQYYSVHWAIHSRSSRIPTSKETWNPKEKIQLRPRLSFRGDQQGNWFLVQC